MNIFKTLLITSTFSIFASCSDGINLSTKIKAEFEKGNIEKVVIMNFCNNTHSDYLKSNVTIESQIITLKDDLYFNIGNLKSFQVEGQKLILSF